MSGGTDPAGAAVLGLLRAIARDVAHELRGPVQAVVVNAEVARRKLADGDADAVAERIDILESEVRRLHAMTDAFVSLLRPSTGEPRMTGIDAVLAPVDPLLAALARATRVQLRRETVGGDALVRIRPQPLALTLTAVVVDRCAAAGPQGEIVLTRHVTDASVDLIVRAVPAPAAPAPIPADGSASAPAIPAIRPWIEPEGGTVEALPGSEPGVPGAVRIQLPRADIA